MNIVLLIAIVIVIFLVITQVKCVNDSDKENFYSDYAYYRNRPRRYNRYYPYGYEWYNYPYFWDYWGNPWGYLPCVNDAFGKTRCY